MNKTAICLMANKVYKFALATMLINLKETNNDQYDNVIVYHDGFSQTELDDLSLLEPRVKFIEYTFEKWNQEHSVLLGDKANNFLNRFSHLAWSKYKIIEQLEHYEKVLYLDLDMLVSGSLEGLFKLDGIAWRNGANFGERFSTNGLKVKNIAEVSNIPESTPAPNGGLLCVTNTIDWKKNLIEAKYFIERFINDFSFALDELAFSYIYVKNNLKLTQLSAYEYNVLPQHLNPSCKVIHFIGQFKPWKDLIIQAEFPKWFEYYQKACLLTDNRISSEQVQEYPKDGKYLTKRLNEQRWFSFLREANLNIPQSLRLRYVFDNEWLIFECNSKVYYEFKFHQYAQGFLMGMWVKDLYKEPEIKREIDNLVGKNPRLFRLHEDHRGLYIYSTKFSALEIAPVFKDFYERTSKLFNIK